MIPFLISLPSPKTSALKVIFPPKSSALSISEIVKYTILLSSVKGVATLSKVVPSALLRVNVVIFVAGGI
jgi:hypothetical protein